MDPKQPQTYIVTAYWLRSSMGKIDEAESFLRQGLRANPGNPEILFELGRIQLEHRKDAVRTRNLWEASLKNIEIFEQKKIAFDDTLKIRVPMYLARLEEDTGNLNAAIYHLKMAVPFLSKPENVLKQIQELEQRLKK
jgi:tetratricopeptide (TPR) repeat protein